MTAVVIDASVALSWCFPDEGSDYADNVLITLEGASILVPAIWSLEVANGILSGHRRANASISPKSTAFQLCCKTYP